MSLLLSRPASVGVKRICNDGVNKCLKLLGTDLDVDKIFIYAAEPVAPRTPELREGLDGHIKLKPERGAVYKCKNNCRNLGFAEKKNLQESILPFF